MGLKSRLWTIAKHKIAERSFNFWWKKHISSKAFGKNTFLIVPNEAAALESAAVFSLPDNSVMTPEQFIEHSMRGQIFSGVPDFDLTINQSDILEKEEDALFKKFGKNLNAEDLRQKLEKPRQAISVFLQDWPISAVNNTNYFSFLLDMAKENQAIKEYTNIIISELASFIASTDPLPSFLRQGRAEVWPNSYECYFPSDPKNFLMNFYNNVIDEVPKRRVNLYHGIGWFSSFLAYYSYILIGPALSTTASSMFLCIGKALLPIAAGVTFSVIETLIRRNLASKYYQDEITKMQQVLDNVASQEQLKEQIPQQKSQRQNTVKA
ncbi:MAG: hypothetical protein PHH14_00965 [Candidatus Margulisbacteria bacterium]|nr:hypothetical protein [Candidatus Margulisiibacteriota bacterium]